MTFFANAGRLSPDLDRKSQDAGRSALKAIAKFYEGVAAIEGNVSPDGRKAFTQSSQGLQYASRLYHELSNSARGDIIARATENELEGASFAGSFATSRNFPGWWMDYYVVWLVDNLGPEGHSVKGLYSFLSKRTADLASKVGQIDTGGADLPKVEPVFSAMSEVEELCSLARYVAVIGSRSGGPVR